MVKPNFIPRTLRGVGGVRLFDLPGVIYPKEMLVAKAGLNHKDGLPYKEAPTHWGMTTNEAASLLGVTASAARSCLHRHKVPYRIVGEEGQALRLYWRRSRVLAIAALRQREPVLKSCPPAQVTSEEAMRILGISRSTLYRYERSGQLSVVRYRHPSARGPRRFCCYKRSEVERLAEYLTFLRLRQDEISNFRRAHRPPLVCTITPNHSRKLYPTANRRRAKLKKK